MAKYQLSKKIKIDFKGVTSKSSSIQSNEQIQTTLPPTLNSSIEPWFRAFNNSSQGLEVQDIAKVFFDRVLDVVKSILGRPDLQLIDLLDLPVVDDSFRFWDVYLSVIVENDTDNVEGVYVGTSLGYKGYREISGRVVMHQRFSARTYDDLPRDVKSYHYSRARKDNVITNFRTVSLFEVIRGNTVATIVAEQVLMVYLSTVAWAYPNQLHLFHESRRGIQDLPDFTHISLNRALPLAQNQHWLPCNKTLHQEWLKETDQEDHCFNCGRPFESLPDERRWKGFFEARRCAACWLYRYKHGEEKHPDLITDARMHEVIPRPINSLLLGWKGWRKTASKCPACARQPTKKNEQMDKTPDEVDEGAPPDIGTDIYAAHISAVYTQIHCPLLPHLLAISTDIRIPGSRPLSLKAKVP
ncbi:hypothetical protein BFJ69_g474 [Fusarium oxysporum]|uniref:Uncharacterized protein n=1 Tax=Fusarium oxysporum TaxID=5507 RepID=A0A420P5C8_FUSOX|nr:hypothetical protein BFJ69_g474 [Fusarium oxysporum]